MKKSVVLEAVYTIKNLQTEIQEQLNNIAKKSKLYRSSVTGSEVWDIYLGGFEHDPIFRDPNSSEHNCNLCKNFIRRYGNVVGIVDNKVVTIWDNVSESEYSKPAQNIAKKLKSAKIQEVFFETFNELNSLNYEKCSKTNSVFRLGLAKNVKRYTKEEAEKFGVVKPNEIKEFNHLHLDVPTAYVDMSGKSVESIMADYRDAKNVFQRAMETISLDTLLLVKDLINQGSLLDGTTHLYKIEQIIPLKREYDELAKKEQDNWCWTKSYQLPFAKFRNELIGVLCSELSEGMELNTACTNWNKRVDPANYMKAKAPITNKQIEEAKKFVEENGYEESFNRRFANIDDIKVSEILHSNVGEGKLKNVSIFDTVKSTSTRHKRSEFDKVEEISIEKFMKDILPSCTSIEAYLENRMQNHMVSLTTANIPDSKPIFKWTNNYSWTYNGNLAGKSQLAERVTSKGGRIDGVFRFTHSWNELEPNQSLMDLHVFFPNNKHSDGIHDNYGTSQRIGWNNRTDRKTKGIQDVDYTAAAPKGHIPVENITFPELDLMPEGTYVCKIHNWAFRGTGGKGRAEIAFGNESYEYVYPATKNKEWVTIAKTTLKDKKFTIEHVLQPTEGQSTEIYGLETNQFHKVNLVCLSPNHWEGNNVGNKHYFFMLEGCKSPVSIRSFHAENLIPELAGLRKVLEPLGNSTMIEPTAKQLSGIGLNSTVKDELILKLSGSHKRVIKLKIGN